MNRPTYKKRALTGKLASIAGSILAAMLLLSPQAQAVPVDLELILLADVSGSIDSTDFALQRDAYEAAFRDAGIIGAIEGGDIGSIAVTLVYWSNSAQQTVSVGWTEINDSASANAFADAIAAAARPFSSSTGLAAALDFATNLVTTDNGFEGTRTVIDVSGDGSDNQSGCSTSSNDCAPVQAARDAALAAGVDAINAVWIEDSPFFCESGCTITSSAYGAANVIGGTGSLQFIASDFTAFSDALREKIETEISGEVQVPAPATLFLLGIGLLGMGLARRPVK